MLWLLRDELLHATIKLNFHCAMCMRFHRWIVDSMWMHYIFIVPCYLDSWSEKKILIQIQVFQSREESEVLFRTFNFSNHNKWVNKNRIHQLNKSITKKAIPTAPRCRLYFRLICVNISCRVLCSCRMKVYLPLVYLYWKWSRRRQVILLATFRGLFDSFEYIRLGQKYDYQCMTATCICTFTWASSTRLKW